MFGADGNFVRPGRTAQVIDFEYLFQLFGVFYLLSPKVSWIGGLPLKYTLYGGL